METKQLPIEACELKFDDDEWRVEGYASAFNSVDLVNDTILPGAFQKSLESGRPVKMYYEHSRIMKPGVWTGFVEDKYGLKVTGHLTRDHSLAKDIRAELRHGTIEGLSIGFGIPQGGSEQKGDIRYIKEIDLHEVSFVGSPAEPKAVITAWKSELMQLKSLSDCEALLRESGGYSRSMATALIGHIKTLCRSESEQAHAAKVRELETAIKLKAAIDKYDLRKLIG